MESRDEKGRYLPGHKEGGPGRPRKGEALTDILNAAFTKKDVRELSRRIKGVLLSPPEFGTRAWRDWFSAIQWLWDRIDGPLRAHAEGEWSIGPTTIIFPDRLRDEDED